MSSQQKENAKGSFTPEGVITHRNIMQGVDDVYKTRIGCSNLALKWRTYVKSAF